MAIIRLQASYRLQIRDFTTSIPTPINDGLYHHISLVSEGGTLTFHVDGTSVGTMPSDGLPTSADLIIASNPTGTARFNGWVGAVEWQATALTAFEIATLANAAASVNANANADIVADAGAGTGSGNGTGSSSSSGTVDQASLPDPIVEGDSLTSQALTVQATVNAQQTAAAQAANAATRTAEVQRAASNAQATDATEGLLIAKRGVNGAFPYDLRMLANGTVQFSRSDGTATPIVTSTAVVNDGSYHFVAAVRGGSDLKIYVDGTLSRTASDTTTAATTSTENLRFGIDANSLIPYAGQLDDVRITMKQLVIRKCQP